MRENASERSDRYVETALAALKRFKFNRLPAKIERSAAEYVVELAKGYVKDARHYSEKRKPVTSLACVAYAEGLLDALKFLELVDF